MAMPEPETRATGEAEPPPAVEALARRVHHNPVGGVLLQADRHGLRSGEFWNGDDPGPVQGPGDAWIDRACAQLDEYFAGTRTGFELPLIPVGTSFQRRVWAALCRIPFARTWSYGRLATEIGSPGASRAVGGANNRNPLPILIPCHRVIGGSGRLVGFGGGLERKRWLLEHEQRPVAPSLFPPEDLRRP